MKSPAVLIALLIATAMATTPHRCVMYLTGQHQVLPPPAIASSITHLTLAFLRSEVFHASSPPTTYPLFTTIPSVRAQLSPSAKVTIAVGGWGDSLGFEAAARTEASRREWSEQVLRMVEVTGADGVDMDWEYPGGNRDDYKIIPNEKRKWEIEAFTLLMQQLRKTLGPDRLLTIAVPGAEVDLIAFTPSTMPRIAEAVNFINVMTYEMMNRRADRIMHHTGVNASQAAVQRYIDRGAPPSKCNLGLAFYLKWYKTTADCNPKYPLGCPTVLMEDPETGADLGGTGGFAWHDEVPEDLAASFTRARRDGFYDDDGSYGYWDREEKLWWSYDTPRVIRESKIPALVDGMGLGGVFAWGVGEDAPEFEHLMAAADGLKKLDAGEAHRDEL